MAIGPELPPHLVKRKRDSDDSESDHEESSGPEKRTRTAGPALPPSTSRPNTNPNEIDLDSSEDDHTSMPRSNVPKPSKSSRSIGPALPPHLSGPSSTNPDEIDLDSDPDEAPSTGPSLPPPKPAKPARRVMGPAMPPHLSAPTAKEEDDSSSDDDIGPAPLAADDSNPTRSIFDDQSRTAEPEPSGPQRDSWMLAPPSGSDWTSRVDPTKLRNRRFASGPRATGAGAAKNASGLGSEWTETLEEKRRRLAKEVMGVAGEGDRASGAAAAGSKDGGAEARRAKEDEDVDRRIREYNEKNRAESLVQQHRRRRDGRDEEEDDPSKRAFDREKDMGAPRISHTQRKEMMDRAANFGSRFSKGSYL